MEIGLQVRRQAAVARSRALSPLAACGGPTATGRSEKAPQRWYRSVRSEEAGKEGSSRIGEYFPFDCRRVRVEAHRSEEHTYELQQLMRSPYARSCMKNT